MNVVPCITKSSFYSQQTFQWIFSNGKTVREGHFPHATLRGQVLEAGESDYARVTQKFTVISKWCVARQYLLCQV